MKYLIVGMGPAAISAARAIRSVDGEGQLVLVSDEPYLPYSRIFITDYLAGKAGLDDMLIDAAEFGAEFLKPERVTAVDSVRREVELASGRTLVYDRLLVASGARPQLPEFPGCRLAGVGGLRTLADAGALARLVDADAPARVVVLGGGLVSLKAAGALTERGAKVTVVVASGQVLSQIIDRTAAGMVQERMARAGVELLLNDDIVEALATGGAGAAANGDAGAVRSVRLRSGRVLPCDALVVGKGVVPNLDFLAGTGVEVVRGVVVDGLARTSVPGLWAAGDVAEGPDLLTGRTEVHATWPNAVAQGRTAGLDMAGAQAEPLPGLRVNAGSFFGLQLASAGLVRAPEGAEEIVLGPDGDFYRKIIVAGGLVTGAMLVGDVNGAGIWQSLIARRIPAASLGDKLGDRTFAYPATVPAPWFWPV